MESHTGTGPPIDDESMRNLYDRIGDAIVVLDAEGRVTVCNARAEGVFERSREAMRGEFVWNLVPESVGLTVRREYERAVESQQLATVELEVLDDWFEARLFPTDTRVTISIRECTDRVRRREQVQRREQALQNAYEIIADPSRSFDDQIEDLLSVVRRTIGVEYAALSCVHEAANEYLFEAVDAPSDADLDAGDTAPLDATNCERVVSTEQTLVLNDVAADVPELADRAGYTEWGISCYLGTPVTAGDDVYGTFCFYDLETHADSFSDWEVTFVELLGNWVSYELDRKRTQRELEASNERLEQFAYAASHDLQEPLRMVSSYLSLIEQRYGDVLDEDGEEFLAYAIDGADRMREMIEGLLAYSRVETRGNLFEPIDLDDLIDDVCADLQVAFEESNATLSRGSLPRVSGDSDQLRQVFQNLLENAITYAGDDPPQISITADRTGDEWTISIADDGIGIEAADSERVFEMFERLHSHEEYAGSGIGLALCRRIVDRHGGEIWIDDEPDAGTTVRFTLPAAPTAES